MRKKSKLVIWDWEDLYPQANGKIFITSCPYDSSYSFHNKFPVPFILMGWILSGEGHCGRKAMKSITPFLRRMFFFITGGPPPRGPPPPPPSFISVFLDSFPVTLKSSGFNLGWKGLRESEVLYPKNMTWYPWPTLETRPIEPMYKARNNHF